MKESNRYWKIRNLIKEGDVGDLYLLEMEETIMEYLEAGSKINAIKYYREVMQTHFNEKVTSIEVAWSNPDVIYVATWSDWWGNKKIYRTDDAGVNWTDITQIGRASCRERV